LAFSIEELINKLFASKIFEVKILPVAEIPVTEISWVTDKEPLTFELLFKVIKSPLAFSIVLVMIFSVSDKVKLPFKAKFPFKVKSLLIVCEELGFAIIGFSIFCYNSIPSPNAKENFNVFALG
jgi:hypothetical protein